MLETKDPQTVAAINTALAEASPTTRTYTMKLHHNVAELFEILREDLDGASELGVSQSNVMKHLILFWFDMINHFGCDREQLAEYIHKIMLRNRSIVMEKNYKYFSPEPLSKPQKGEENTTQDIPKQTLETLAESA